MGLKETSVSPTIEIKRESSLIQFQDPVFIIKSGIDNKHIFKNHNKNISSAKNIILKIYRYRISIIYIIVCINENIFD